MKPTIVLLLVLCLWLGAAAQEGQPPPETSPETSTKPIGAGEKSPWERGGRLLRPPEVEVALWSRLSHEKRKRLVRGYWELEKTKQHLVSVRSTTVELKDELDSAPELSEQEQALLPRYRQAKLELGSASRGHRTARSRWIRLLRALDPGARPSPEEVLKEVDLTQK